MMLGTESTPYTTPPISNPTKNHTIITTQEIDTPNTIDEETIIPPPQHQHPAGIDNQSKPSEPKLPLTNDHLSLINNLISSSSSLTPSNLKLTSLDSPQTIKNKILELPIPTLLSLLREIMIPLSPPHQHDDPDVPPGTVFTVEVAIWCFGCCVRKHYKCYEDVERDFFEGGMGEEDLKGAVVRGVGVVLEGMGGEGMRGLLGGGRG